MEVARISVGGKGHSAKIYLTKTFENFKKLIKNSHKDFENFYKIFQK